MTSKARVKHRSLVQSRLWLRFIKAAHDTGHDPVRTLEAYMRAQLSSWKRNKGARSRRTTA